MDFAGSAEDFYSAPWPNDLRLKENGSLDLSGFPIYGNPYLTDTLPVVEANTFGFSPNGAIYLAFTAPIDPDSLPGDPEASLAPEASVYLIDIDPGSDSYGERAPLLFKFYDEAGIYQPANLLAALPFPGFPLAPAATHALVVTTRLLDETGRPVGDCDPGWASESINGPLVDFLETQGDGIARTVGATVFTTMDPVAPLRVAARRIAGLPSPEPDPRCWQSVVTEPDDTRDDNLVLVQGCYKGLNFQEYRPDFLNPDPRWPSVIRFDDSGVPILQNDEPMRFFLTIPLNSPMPVSGWPLVLYHHGTGGTARSFYNDGTAFNLAEEGVAAIGIDAPLHGERDPDPPNGPNRFFNFIDVLAGRDNTRQGALDLLILERMVQRITLDAEASPTGQAVRIDPDRLMYMGHSQGGVTGPLYLALSTRVRGAMLSGAGGSLAASIVYKKDPADFRLLAEALLEMTGQESLDMFHPLVSIVQNFTDPADPLNYAPYYYRRHGGRSFDVWLTHGLEDLYVPTPVTNALATAIGVHPVAPLAREVEGLTLRGLTVRDPPLHSNLTTSDLRYRTGVYTQYEEGDHFLIRNDPGAVRQLRHWFRSLAYEGFGEIVGTDE